MNGTVRNGRIEPDASLPPDWVEGSAISIRKSGALPTEIDLTGDSPEAVAAWVAHYEELHRRFAGSSFPDALAQTLTDAKAEELALWAEGNRRAEVIFP